jgi:GntR family transcriptional regulator
VPTSKCIHTSARKNKRKKTGLFLLNKGDPLLDSQIKSFYNKPVITGLHLLPFNSFQENNRIVVVIDKTSPLPYYVQLKEILCQQIDAGEWKPGDQIPGEPELCQTYAVSRTVVRQALQEMTYENRVVREKGRGTFVSRPKISESLIERLTGFYEDMSLRGYPPVSQVLKQVLAPANEKIAAALHLSVTTAVIEIQRLRFVQEEPITLVTTFLPYQLCPKLLEVDLTHRSLYQFIEEECNVFIARGKRTFEAVAAGEQEAQLLRVEKGAPLIRLESVSYTAEGLPVEVYYALHRGDRSRFEIELVRTWQKNI